MEGDSDLAFTSPAIFSARFVISCSFLHQSPAPENCELKNDIVKLKEDLQLVITSLNIKDIEIKKLEEKVT